MELGQSVGRWMWDVGRLRKKDKGKRKNYRKGLERGETIVSKRHRSLRELGSKCQSRHCEEDCAKVFSDEAIIIDYKKNKDTCVYELIS